MLGSMKPLYQEFKKGEEIIEYRGLSSAASIASAIYDHINILENGSDDCEAIGVMSSGEYNIASNLMFSFPMNITRESYSIIENVKIDSSLAELIKISEAELIKERDIVRQYLPE